MSYGTKPPPADSHIVRTFHRRALRTHPQAETILAGRKVNQLNKAELLNGLVTLGLDPDLIARQALASPAPVTSPAPTCDNLPQVDAAGTGLFAPNMAENLDLGDGEQSPPVDEIEVEVQSIRSLVVQGGFVALDQRLRDLVTEARKPPVEIVRTVEIMVPGPTVTLAGSDETRPAQVIARQTGATASWRSLFRVHGSMGHRDLHLWDGAHPSTPFVDDEYVWPQPATAIALAILADGGNAYLYGPAGCGKTDWARQFAARTGRPYVLISCDNGTDAATLVGLTVPHNGSVRWQDGALTKAIRTPGCIVCVDEPSVARAGALMVMQDLLQNRTLHIAETGEVVRVAPGVLFVCTDNTAGNGGGARQGYSDTNRLNAAFLDRFAARIDFDFLPKDKEIAVVVAKTGCTVELATLLVNAAQVTRAAAANQGLSRGIGLRRLLSWARLLTAGIRAEDAFRVAVLNCADDQDRESLREQCLLTYDRDTVAAALNPSVPVLPDPVVTNPTPAGRDAAADFCGGPTSWAAHRHSTSN